MSWKSAVNSALTRATGHVIVDPEAVEARIRTEAERLADERVARLRERHREDLAEQRRKWNAELQARRERQKAARQKRREERLVAEAEAREQERAAARARGEHLPAYFDDQMRATAMAVDSRTMTTPQKLAGAIEAARHIAQRRIPGAVVECGVWRGGSMMAIARTLADLGDTDRELHLFDTFEGMPPPSEEDVRSRDGRSASELLADDSETMVLAAASLEDVQAGMATVDYPAEHVHYHVGMVEDTIPGDAPDQIALLRLDTDWYASTKHELEQLWDRLSPGGILILDDFGDWDGARKATLEWMETSGNHLFLAPMGAGRIAVKPR